MLDAVEESKRETEDGEKEKIKSMFDADGKKIK